MRAEVIAVGTELLLGQIDNTNATWISRSMASIGVDVLFHTTVGDNLNRIADAIKAGMARVDVVIITGGLGPTHDDLTREAIAAATGRQLRSDPRLVDWIRSRFEAFGRPMAPSNLRQADVPEGATSIPNPLGTAPGIALEHEGKKIFAVPGVPSEMEPMIAEHIVAQLGAAEPSVLVSRVLKTTGEGESSLAHRIKPIIDELDAAPGATIALLASPGEVRIRISAKAPDRDLAYAAIAPVEQRLRALLASAVFGVDDDTLESVTARVLLERGLSLAVAESFTGGLVAARITSVPGVSEAFKAGFVTYSNDSKVSDLGVDAAVIREHGAVSEQTAIQMAIGARAKAGADLGLATTGEAGPQPSEAEVGKMFLAVSDGADTQVRSFVAPGSRESIRRWGAQGAINLLRLFLNEQL